MIVKQVQFDLILPDLICAQCFSFLKLLSKIYSFKKVQLICYWLELGMSSLDLNLNRPMEPGCGPQSNLYGDYISLFENKIDFLGISRY